MLARCSFLCSVFFLRHLFLAMLMLASVLSFGQGGSCIEFDGTNDYISVPNHSSLNLTGNTITLEAWIYPTAWQNNYFEGSVVVKEAVSISGYMLRVGDDGTLGFTLGNGSSWFHAVSPSGTLTLNRWQHIAGVLDGTNMTVYVDGVEVATQTFSGNIASNSVTLSIGITEIYSSRTFQGKIDEVRIWSDARTLSEIQANMHKSLTGSESNLVAYYSMSDASGTTLTDNSTNTNNGTLINSPVWKTSGALAGPGMALDFDGTNDQVQAAINMTPGSVLTIEGWFNFNSLTNQQNLAHLHRQSPTTTRIVPYKTSDHLIALFIYDGSNTYVVNSTYTVAQAGVWHHLAFVYNAGNVAIYVNGQPAGTSTGNGSFTTSATNTLYIGSDPGALYANVKIDEFRLWSAARTEAEIRANKDRTLDGTEANLLAYYRFDQQPDASNTTLHDLSSNGHHGTLTNMDAATDWVSGSPFNTWIGSESGDWSNAENWSRGSVPSGEDVGIFPWAGSSAPSSANISGRNFYVASGNTVSHSGNLTLTGEFYNEGTFATSGTATFSGSATQAIRGTGATTFGTLVINNSNGVTMEQNITTSTGLTLTSGALSIGANTLTLNGIVSQTSGSLTGGSSSCIAIGEAGLRLDLPAVTLNNLNLDRVAGSALTGNVTVNGTLTLTEGVLNVGANTLTLGTAASVAGSPGTSNHIQATSGSLRKNYSGTGSFVFPVGDGAAYSPITLNFTSGSFSSGYATVSVTNAKHPGNVSATDFLNRYWTVSSSGISGFSCNVSAQYADDDINGTEAAITGGKYSAGTWTDLGAVTAGSNLITGTVSGFSDFTGGEPAAFPVEWLNFAARAEGSSTLLEWATASEQNSDFFAVERSANRNEWTSLGIVAAAGNSDDLREYTYLDQAPQAGKNYYRLRQVDIDGKMQYSALVEMTFDPAPLSVYPNPAHNWLNVTEPGESGQLVKIFELTGREVYRALSEDGKISLQGLAPGVYGGRLDMNKGELRHFTFIKD